MNPSDILIRQVLEHDGRPKMAVPTRRDDEIEELWQVTASDRSSLTLHPLELAIDVARQWQQQRGGDIYLRGVSDKEPQFYAAAS